MNAPRTIIRRWLALCLLGTALTGAKAQTPTEQPLPIVGDSLLADPVLTDTILTDSGKLEESRVMKGKTTRFVPDPIRAMWLGLIFPGGGQIYNRKYWKLPIIYGGFLGCIYALNWNNQMLRDYTQAYLDIMDSDPNTKSYEKMLPMGYNIAGRESQFQTIFKNKKNFYRRYRDMSVFVFAAVYVISVIDAYVDAELSTFDISEDLSLRISPAVISPGSNRHQRQMMRGSQPTDTGVGLAFQLHF